MRQALAGHPAKDNRPELLFARIAMGIDAKAQGLPPALAPDDWPSVIQESMLIDEGNPFPE